MLRMVLVALMVGGLAGLAGAVGQGPEIFTGPVFVSSPDTLVPCAAPTTATVQIDRAHNEVRMTTWNPCGLIFYGDDGTAFLVGAQLLHYVAAWQLDRDCATGAGGVLACVYVCDAMTLVADGAFAFSFTQVGGRHWDVGGTLHRLAK